MNRNKIFWLTTIGVFTLIVLFMLLGPKENSADSLREGTGEKGLETESSLEAAPKSETEEAGGDVRLSLEMGDLPTMEDLQELSEEEVHGTPLPVLKAGEKIGSLIEDADQHPEKQEPTLKFFMSCAENNDVVPAIRALCWNKALTQIPKWEKVIPLNDYDVPLEIQTLGSEL